MINRGRNNYDQHTITREIPFDLSPFETEELKLELYSYQRITYIVKEFHTFPFIKQNCIECFF